MMKMFIKAADVSNETRPMDIAEPWLDCLLQEFFRQVTSYYSSITSTSASSWAQSYSCVSIFQIFQSNSTASVEKLMLLAWC